MRNIHPEAIDILKPLLVDNAPVFVKKHENDPNKAYYRIGVGLFPLFSPELALTKALLSEGGLGSHKLLLDNERLLELLSSGLTLFDKTTVGGMYVSILSLGEVYTGELETIDDGRITIGIIEDSKNIELVLNHKGTAVSQIIDRRLLLKLVLDEMDRLYPEEAKHVESFFRVMADMKSTTGTLTVETSKYGYSRCRYSIPDDPAQIRTAFADAFSKRHVCLEKALLTTLIENGKPLTADAEELSGYLQEINDTAAIMEAILEEGGGIKPVAAVKPNGVLVAQSGKRYYLCCSNDKGEQFAAAFSSDYLNRRIKELEEATSSLPDYLKTNLNGV